MERKGLPYWGPVLIVVGLIAVAAWGLTPIHSRSFWFLGCAVTVALVGVVIVGYVRQR